MRGQAATPEEVRRRSLSCQRQRQKLLRAAVENSTSQWAQQVFSTRCSLPALAHLWRQQTGGGCDFEHFAQRVVRHSRSRLRSPSETSVGSSRRSASEPRHWPPLRATAPPPGQAKRRHSVAVPVPVLPAAIYGHYVCVAPTVSEPVHGIIGADQIHRTPFHKSGEKQMKHDYSGVRTVDGMQQICLVPHAVPVLVLCKVGMTPANQWAAPSAGAEGRASGGRGETADKWTQTEARRSFSQDQPRPRRSPRGHVAQAAVSKPTRSRTRTLPGNFAELEKSWACNAGSYIKVGYLLPSKNIRL